MQRLKTYWPEILFSILTIGGVIFLLAGVEDIIKLTPLYLLMNTGLLIYAYRNQKSLLYMIITAASIGFFAEFIGVQTGLLFGDYIYGSVLGPKILDVPIMVCVMWALVMLVLWAIVPRNLGWWRVPFVASLAVLYDLVLEHFATRFDLWAWQGSIPLSNYVGWFLVAFIIAAVFHINRFHLKSSIIAYTTLPFHILFFLIAVVSS